MSKPQTMHARDAVSAGQAECYVTIDGERINFMQAKNVKAEIDKTKTSFGILGRVAKGNKSTGAEYSASAEFYANTSIFRKIFLHFQETGEDIYFDMQLTNEDPTSSVGRQTVILKDCNLDSGIIAQFDVDEEILTDSIDFTYESFLMPETYKDLDGMR